MAFLKSDMGILKSSSVYTTVLIFFLFIVHYVQAQPSQEYQIKAVFLFNFAQFVEWPLTAFPDEKAPLIIGVLGKDPFGNYLDQTVKGEIVNGHPLQVQRFKSYEEIKSCHILFINLSEKEQKKAIETLKGQHILTVGDMMNFAKNGGMIRFYNENNKTRIRINLEAVKEAELSISSKLLRLAEIVETQTN